ncbi:MAG: glutathione S-transferase family protein [Pseudomonadota bacterium]
MAHQFTLVSHLLCPYVQRAAIVLQEKAIAFERIDIDLANKPDWFLKVSPLGKTPVLLVDGESIFESAVICDYLDESTRQPLHPQDPLQRAKHRAWGEFASFMLNGISAFYNAADDAALATSIKALKAKSAQLEAVLSAGTDRGDFFAGNSFCMVDAAFAPVFRYFDVFDRIEDFGVFTHTPMVNAWRMRLQQRPSVQQSVRADYPALLRQFLLARKSALSMRMAQS